MIENIDKNCWLKKVLLNNWQENISVEIVVVHYLYIEDITRWREDMNFIFEW
jgi:hypothetical protein